MGIGEPKMPSPEEIAEIQKSRTLSDAELLKGGADFILNEEHGGVRFEPTSRQRFLAERDMKDDLEIAQGKKIYESASREDKAKYDVAIEYYRLTHVGDALDKLAEKGKVDREKIKIIQEEVKDIIQKMDIAGTDLDLPDKGWEVAGNLASEKIVMFKEKFDGK